MQPLTPAQAAEAARYGAAYANPDYRTGPDRLRQVVALLAERPDLRAGALLDVGCGRGEVLDAAAVLGYARAIGTEVVEALTQPPRIVRAAAWDLPWPDGAFGTVACCDVLEHLLHADQAATVAELARVAARRLVLTIGMGPSADWAGLGDLHVGRRAVAEWDRLLGAWLVPAGWSVLRRSDRDVGGLSCAWEAVR